MSGSSYTSLVRDLPSTVPFVGPETQERAMGRPFRARLGANENGFGPSQKAVEAMARAAGEVWQYGDPENHDLKKALADVHGVKSDNIIVGEGIDALLGYLTQMIITDKTPVVTSLGAYPTFNFHVSRAGGTLHMVPFHGDHEDPEALLTKAKETKAPLIYFANPDNPMGTWHNADVVQSLIDQVPDGSLLILDEAYIEFAPAGAAPPLDVTNDKVIRFRTFSKAYGMAGARIGYGIGEARLIDAFNKVRNHFGVNRIAQIGALASLHDEEHIPRVRELVNRARNRIKQIAEKNGLSALESTANFVAIDCGRDGAYAKAVLNGLAEQGVFVRMPGVPPQNRCIRVSTGPDAALEIFAETLPIVIAGLQA